MVKIDIPKKIPSVKVFKTIKVSGGNWYNGKFYVPLNSLTKKGRSKIVSAIKLGNSNRYLYTLDKKRRTRGFAPKNLIK